MFHAQLIVFCLENDFHLKRNYLNFFFVPEGQSMDYSEVVSAFSQLVETHFLQRCPPVASAGPSNSEVVDPPPPPPAVTPSEPEKHPDCYRVPYINLTGQLLLLKHLSHS